MSLTITPLDIPDVLLLKTEVHADARGSLIEIYRSSVYAAAGLPKGFVQENIAVSRKHVLRGLHFQRAPKAQGKLLRCVRGKIFDVAVDLRKRSDTFGRWTGQTLTADGGEMIYIPEGFAHGFLVLSDEAIVLYQLTREYAPGSEAGIRWDDPRLGIPWPVKSVILSEKDRHLPLLGDLQWDDQP